MSLDPPKDTTAADAAPQQGQCWKKANLLGWNRLCVSIFVTIFLVRGLLDLGLFTIVLPHMHSALPRFIVLHPSAEPPSPNQPAVMTKVARGLLQVGVVSGGAGVEVRVYNLHKDMAGANTGI